MEKAKKISLTKKILIGVGIYFVVSIIAVVIIIMIDDSQEQKDKELQAKERQAQEKIAEMDAIYDSHNPQVFQNYGLSAAEA